MRFLRLVRTEVSNEPLRSARLLGVSVEVPQQSSARERTTSARFRGSRVGGHKQCRPTRAYDPVAQAFVSQSAQNRFSTAFRVTNLERSASRAARVAEYVAMLSRGETLH